jgi:hypothetical protein
LDFFIGEIKMGRPLNKKYFGADANNNLRVQFNNGTSSVAGAIVKQKGSKRFVCVDASSTTATCKLVAKADGSLTAGEMSITVTNDAGTDLFVTKISAHRITASNGISYPWNFSSSTSDGAVQVEEAGSDATFTGNVDLT